MATDSARFPLNVEEMQAEVYVVVCMPSGENIKAYTARNLFMLGVKFCQTEFVRDGKPLTKAIGYINIHSSILPAGRDATARQALVRAGVTHLLWIDSDMVFPDDTIHRLWQHDLDVVGANCPRKMMPVTPTCEKLDGSYLWTTEKSTGLEETRRIGCGVTLTKAGVYCDLPEPWFPFSYDYDVRGYDGEDTNFSRALREAGYRLWVDHDLSKQVQHVGSFAFDHRMCEEWSGGKTLIPDDLKGEIGAPLGMEDAA